MTDREELEVRLATTLAPMLLAIATFSLTIMALEQTPDKTIADEVFAVLGAFCLLGAAAVADSALDRHQMKWHERVTFIGGGYFLFSIVVGAMSFAIPMLYQLKRSSPAPVSWHNSYFLFMAAGLSVLFRLMSHEWSRIWTACSFVFFVCSVYALLR